jgi:phospholipid/cholesterol/gamma-HCH transport system permease protein
MSAPATRAPALPRPAQPLAWLRRLLAAVGRPPLQVLRWLALAAGFSFAALAVALRPITWRRPVRAEFMRSMRQAGVQGVRPAVFTGVLIGLAMVYQALYWLQVAGQANLIGEVLVLVLVREIAPLVIGLMLIGRSGIALLLELSALRSAGQIRMLEAQGIDPIQFLVVPRVVAFAASAFCLVMVFLTTALLVGYFAGQAVGAVNLSLYQFFDNLLHAMGPREYALLLLKTLAMGFIVGVTSALAALAGAAAERYAGKLTARGFVLGVMAIFVVSGAVSMVL